MDNFQLKQSEMISLIILFEIGSAVVIGLGMGAKQDAWLAILIGLACGCILFTIYHFILKEYPGLSLVEILQTVVGQKLGTLLSVAYACYFLYIAARVLRDFCELLLGSALSETPPYIVLIIFALAITYALYLGVEVMGRTAPLFFSFSLSLWFIFLLGVVISKEFHFIELMPVLEHGWKPVLKTAFPLVTTFPFGEMIVFTMFSLYVSKNLSFYKIGLAGMIISGFILVITITINIGINGAYQTSESLFPLLLTVTKIKLGDFINRLDPIVIALLIIGGFFKVTIFQWGAVQVLSRSLAIQSYRKLILPVSLLALTISLVMASNIIEHLDVGLKIVPLYLHIPFQIVIPVLLLTIIKIRRKLRG
ncbi:MULTISPECIES: GerAB/ArcD/ProY family transporter [unclassified Bacillus (in: firmicutes)]|uniref:GerAB/ArcD/ProY family transporter n=1 Tax=unclassified Bacillus (in: firmicutes) TaxID=185979 RepID=UPI0015871AD1|nr:MULTISPECIES: GerAB/ArcD/ProY family transporter [unclassified Bacillus (in: firmicutes)]